MMRRKNIWFVAAVVLLLLVAASAVYAQGGESGGDKFVFGRNFVLRSGETLDGSLAVVGGSAELAPDSIVNGDVFVAGGKLSVAGAIHGSAAVFGGSTLLSDSAVVEGDFAMFGGTLDRAPGATIRGEVFSGLSAKEGVVSPDLPAAPELPVLPQFLSQAQPFGGLKQVISWEIATVSSALMLIILGIIVVLVAPKAVGRIASAAADQSALSFGAGILTWVVGLLGGLLLLIACCLGVFVWLALAVALLLGWISVGVWLGQRILGMLKIRNASSLLEVAVGVFLITLVANLPWCIGFLFTVIVGSVGLGAVVLTRFGGQPASPAGQTPPSAPPRLEDLDAEVLAPVNPPGAPEPPMSTEEVLSGVPVSPSEPIAPAPDNPKDGA